MNSAEKRKEYQKKYQSSYRQSKSGKLAQKRYNQSEKGKIRDKRRSKSEKRKISQRRHKQTEKYKFTSRSYQKRYNQSEKGKLRRRRYEINRKSHDLQFKLAGNLRARLNAALKSNQKAGSVIRDLGCSILELKVHLESKFQPGMTWENYGREGWHIDHIVPLASFDLTNREQFLKANHYTNLQPLWAKDNIIKKDNV